MMIDGSTIQFIAEVEGLRSIAYDDANGQFVKAGYTMIGNPTIGMGRNLAGKGITQAEAIMLCTNDIDESIADLISVIPGFDSWDRVRQHAMISVRMNLGPSRFRTFTKMIAKLKADDFVGAADELLASERAKQLIQRSHTEARMLRHG